MFTFNRRLAAAAFIGVLAWAGASALGAPLQSRILIGWNIGAAVYLAASWVTFLSVDPAKLREGAVRQDERRAVILAVGLVAVAASLAAILGALLQVQGETKAARDLVRVLAALTLASSWGVLQTLFTAHYAHRHFEAEARHGTGSGFLFPGSPAASYLDFAYVAICIGATAQISDVSVARTRLRNLVTAHSATSFFYNTAVVAFGINILSGLIGH
ncbi:MAG TPA: DUF1345 domain-containing protein [Caulobacteraceae bacterium]|nr:DUF1345 domain-containing protein [Caulobacteraceae bacterium]